MTIDALKMGEYGLYVWSSYGLTFVVLLWLACYVRHACVRELKHARRRAQQVASDNGDATNAVDGRRA